MHKFEELNYWCPDYKLIMELGYIRVYVKAVDYAATGSFTELSKKTQTVVLSLV